MTKRPQALVFLDAEGGGLAALAAGVARANGREAQAFTTSSSVHLPGEIADVLGEIGAELPPVARRSPEPKAGPAPIFVGEGPPPAGLPFAAIWPAVLPTGEGTLERLSTTRITRDRLERRLLASTA